MKFLIGMFLVLPLLLVYGNSKLTGSSINQNKSLGDKNFIKISSTPSRFDSFSGVGNIQLIKEFSSPILGTSNKLINDHPDLKQYYDIVKKLIDSEPKEFIFALDHSGFIEITIRKDGETLKLSKKRSTKGMDSKSENWVNKFHKTYSDLLLYLSKSAEL